MGRFLTMCTLAADLLGLGASYSIGTFIFPSIGSVLPGWLLWLRSFCSYLYGELFHLIGLIPHVPPTIPLMLTRHPGLTWCILYLVAHLWYVIRSFYRRYHEADLAKPRPGAPGGRRWETAQRRYQDYQEDLRRFRPEITLKTPPTFRFFTRKQGLDRRGEMEWHGRLLIIDQALLSSDRLQDLVPGLAHQLAYYNGEDLWFRAFLDCYPDSLSLLQIISGIGLWLPTLLKIFVWPVVYWRGRVLVADRFTFYCGQGYALYQQIGSRLGEEEPRTFWSPLPLRSERLEQLEALLGTEASWMEQQTIASSKPVTQIASRESYMLPGRECRDGIP